MRVRAARWGPRELYEPARRAHPAFVTLMDELGRTAAGNDFVRTADPGLKTREGAHGNVERKRSKWELLRSAARSSSCERSEGGQMRLQ